MGPYGHVGRYREIVGILVDEGFESVLSAVGLARFAPVRSRLNRGHSSETIPVRLRYTLERLGPTFVKLGQAASCRSDLIPDDIIAELRKLQDHVEPFPFVQAKAIIEAELGGSIDEMFASFEPEPVAAASLGQVHAALLPDGTSVAVKVQRPGVRETVEADIDIILTQARFIENHSELADQYDFTAIVTEFVDALRDELDYVAEGNNADRLRLEFMDDDTVAFPRVHWEYSTSRVLTMDRFEGIPLNRLEQLDEAGCDRPELARRGILCYLDQIFSNGFFHADPHPGNLFALPDGRVGFTDFGRVGTISDLGRSQLADLFLAIIDKDITLASDTLVEAAGSPGSIDVSDLEREISRLINKYYNVALREVSMSEMIGEVLAMVRDHHLILPSELTVLLATLAQLEGLGVDLDPDFDFVAATTPYARTIVRRRLEPDALSSSLLQSLRKLAKLAIELPESMGRLIHRAGTGEFRMAIHPVGFDPLMRRFEVAVNRLAFAMVVSAFVIGLSILLTGTEMNQAFTWLARFAWAAAIGVGAWFFIAAISARVRRRND